MHSLGRALSLGMGADLAVTYVGFLPYLRPSCGRCIPPLFCKNAGSSNGGLLRGLAFYKGIFEV